MINEGFVASGPAKMLLDLNTLSNNTEYTKWALVSDYSFRKAVNGKTFVHIRFVDINNRVVVGRMFDFMASEEEIARYMQSIKDKFVQIVFMVNPRDFDVVVHEIKVLDDASVEQIVQFLDERRTLQFSNVYEEFKKKLTQYLYLKDLDVEPYKILMSYSDESVYRGEIGGVVRLMNTLIPVLAMTGIPNAAIITFLDTLVSMAKAKSQTGGASETLRFVWASNCVITEWTARYSNLEDGKAMKCLQYMSDYVSLMAGMEHVVSNDAFTVWELYKLYRDDIERKLASSNLASGSIFTCGAKTFRK